MLLTQEMAELPRLEIVEYDNGSRERKIKYV